MGELFLACLAIAYKTGALVSASFVLADVMHLRGRSRCPACQDGARFLWVPLYRTFCWPHYLFWRTP